MAAVVSGSPIVDVEAVSHCDRDRIASTLSHRDRSTPSCCRARASRSGIYIFATRSASAAASSVSRAGTIKGATFGLPRRTVAGDTRLRRVALLSLGPACGAWFHRSLKDLGGLSFHAEESVQRASLSLRDATRSRPGKLIRDGGGLTDGHFACEELSAELSSETLARRFRLCRALEFQTSALPRRFASRFIGGEGEWRESKRDISGCWHGRDEELLPARVVRVGCRLLQLSET